MKYLITIALIVLSICTGSISAGAQGQYKVQQTFHIGGMARWDYIAVCPVSDNIYVSHATQVNVINKNTGDSVGVILNTTGVHGIAFAADMGKGFVSNGKLHSVTVFDIKTNEVTAQINVGENPDAIMYDPFSKAVYVCNGRSKDLTIINAADNTVVATVPLGGKPETAVSDEQGRIYINIEDKNEIAVLDTKSRRIVARWKIGTGTEPSGLAIDIAAQTLFAGCDNRVLIVMNAANGKVIKELPIGEGCDGVVFDPGNKCVFSSNGAGTVTVIKEQSANDITVVQTVPTKQSARTIAVDVKTHKLYLPAADRDAEKKDESGRGAMVPGSFEVLVVGI